MRESAVFTTVMSSISIIVAAQTTARVQRWVLCMCVSAPGREERGGGVCHSRLWAASGLRREPADTGTGTWVPLGAAASSARILAMDREEPKARLDRVLVGGREKRAVVIAEPEPAWPRRFEVEGARIARALGDRALRIEHIGSTAVPGLAAKPIVDMLVEVAALDEAGLAPRL